MGSTTLYTEHTSVFIIIYYRTLVGEDAAGSAEPAEQPRCRRGGQYHAQTDVGPARNQHNIHIIICLSILGYFFFIFIGKKKRIQKRIPISKSPNHIFKKKKPKSIRQLAAKNGIFVYGH